jgi:hypothetical protein
MEGAASGLLSGHPLLQLIEAQRIKGLAQYLMDLEPA